MNNYRAQDLKIMGSSSAAGGTYKHVKIMGDGRINGELSCEQLYCAGNANLYGSVHTREMKVRGSLNMRGELVAEQLSVHGNTDIEGDAHVREGSISGMLNVGRHLRSEKLNIKGGVNVEGNCASESIVATGALNIKGLLNVGKFDLSVSWPCQVREIGGEWIQVRKGGILSNLMSIIPSIFKSVPNATLQADIIEGDLIDIEQTEARIVRGNDVRIGAGCVLGRVEYRANFIQHPDSRIQEVVRV